MRPQPKAEIVIHKFSHGEHLTILQIYTYSEAAQDWINREISTFGNPVYEKGFINLIVSPGYDAGEVEMYLLAMEEETED